MKVNSSEYVKLHNDLKKKRGVADRCTNREKGILDFSCSEKSDNFQWANKSKHYKGVDDFFMLCVSCHRKYDKVTPPLQNKITPEQAREIKNSKGIATPEGIAERYGITALHVYDIWAGRNWNNI